MIFNSTISKVGKTKNISVYMPNKNKILIYYFNDGIFLKTIDFSSESTVLTKSNTFLAYNEVIPLGNNFLLTRIGKSMEIIQINE